MLGILILGHMDAATPAKRAVASKKLVTSMDIMLHGSKPVAAMVAVTSSPKPRLHDHDPS